MNVYILTSDIVHNPRCILLTQMYIFIFLWCINVWKMDYMLSSLFLTVPYMLCVHIGEIWYPFKRVGWEEADWKSARVFCILFSNIICSWSLQRLMSFAAGPIKPCLLLLQKHLIDITKQIVPHPVGRSRCDCQMSSDCSQTQSQLVSCCTLSGGQKN